MGHEGITPEKHYIPDHITVVNHSSMISDEEVAWHTKAMDIQMREHIAPLWDAEPPGVSFHGHAENVQELENTAALLAYVNDDGNADSAGYHTEVGGFVYGLIDVGQSRRPEVTGSHEAGEIYGNAKLVRLVHGPKNRRYYVELMDPTQRQTYKIPVTMFGQTREIDVSDFVLPAWFGMPNVSGRDARRTYLDQNVQPFEVAPGGYQIALTDDDEVLFLSKGEFASQVSKHSRTNRIRVAADKARRAALAAS